VVVAAKDKKAKDPENDLVAIKKIEKAFEHKVFTKRTLRELKMLRLMNHENVKFNFVEILILNKGHRDHNLAFTQVERNF